MIDRCLFAGVPVVVLSFKALFATGGTFDASLDQLGADQLKLGCLRDLTR